LNQVQSYPHKQIAELFVESRGDQSENVKFKIHIRVSGTAE